MAKNKPYFRWLKRSRCHIWRDRHSVLSLPGEQNHRFFEDIWKYFHQKYEKLVLSTFFKKKSNTSQYVRPSEIRMDLRGNKTTAKTRLSCNIRVSEKNNGEFTKWKMLPHAYKGVFLGQSEILFCYFYHAAKTHCLSNQIWSSLD